MIGGWTATDAFYRALALVVFALGLGVSTGRADLVVLGAPIALSLMLAAPARPWRADRMRTPTARATVGDEVVSGSSVTVRTRIAGLADTELVTVLQPETTARPAGAARTVAGGRERHVEASVATRSWGPTIIARPDLMAIGPDGLFLAGPLPAAEVTELVLPSVAKLSPLQLPPINGGWAGAHLSRRPGQGSDLVDLREYAPGDRMRSVHWRAYARLGKLYTRRTLSDADADLMICLDVRHNIGPRLPAPPSTMLQRLSSAVKDAMQLLRDARSARTGGPGHQDRLDAVDRARHSSLDHTVHAAAGIASAQLGAGDRVGVMTISTDRRSLRPGTGTRHLQRIRYFLARLTTTGQRMVPVSYWGLRPGAVVILCTALVDDSAGQAALDCASRGHQVLVVDTLPQQGILRSATPADLEHVRLLTVQRELRIDTIRRSGVPVLSWDCGNIEFELATALRIARSRR